MSSPDDSERSDDASNSDYAAKWARDSYRQGSPDRGGRPISERDLTHLRRSLDPEIVPLPQRDQPLDPEIVDSPQPPPLEAGVVRYQRRLRHCGDVRSRNRVVIHW
jgi:hypothetical protein